MELTITKSQYLQNIKESLFNTDYIAIKAYEGLDCSKYGDWKAQRQTLRDEYYLVLPMTEEEFQEYIKDKGVD